jgi:hypothetical protein
MPYRGLTIAYEHTRLTIRSREGPLLRSGDTETRSSNAAFRPGAGESLPPYGPLAPRYRRFDSMAAIAFSASIATVVGAFCGVTSLSPSATVSAGRAAGSPTWANDRTVLTLTFACTSLRVRSKIGTARRSIVFPSSSTAYLRCTHTGSDSATSSKISKPSGAPSAASPVALHVNLDKTAELRRETFTA